jgi:P-type Cu+ transporter
VNAVSLLGQLRGSDALLLVPKQVFSAAPSSFARTEDEMEKASLATEDVSPSRGLDVQKVSIDLLDVGDIVRVQPGSTPPADGTIVSTEATTFDESSLTGESREVRKEPGDQVFVGTINKSRVVEVRVDAIGGETMYVFYPIASFWVA